MAYADKFKVWGPYTRKDNRKIVIVVDRKGKRRTVSYPKWIMEIHLGRKLDPDKETVDHWDSDFDNNDLSNLKLVPRHEHSANDTRRVKMVKFNYAWCDKEFERSPRLIRDKAKKKKSGPFCSRSCAGKYSRMIQLKLIDKFDSQQAIDSEYYKRKYVTASHAEWQEPIDYLDLVSYASEDDYLYHITYYKNLESISSDGLLPGAGSALGHGGNVGRSRGRIFFTDKEGIIYWYGKLEDMCEHHSDNPLEDEMVPVVLRTIRFDEDEEDPTAEGASYQNQQEIVRTEGVEPDDLEVWTGKAWEPVENYYKINLSDALIEECEDDDSEEDIDEEDSWKEEKNCWYYFKDTFTENPLVPR